MVFMVEHTLDSSIHEGICYSISWKFKRTLASSFTEGVCYSVSLLEILFGWQLKNLVEAVLSVIIIIIMSGGGHVIVMRLVVAPLMGTGRSRDSGRHLVTVLFCMSGACCVTLSLAFFTSS